MLLAAFPGWSLLPAFVGWGVPRQSWRRALQVQFPANRGLRLLVASIGLVVPRQSWRRALWVVFPANPSYGLAAIFCGVVRRQFWGRALRVLFLGLSLMRACCWPWWVAWFFVHLGGGPYGCISPPTVARACCYL